MKQLSEQGSITVESFKENLEQVDKYSLLRMWALGYCLCAALDSKSKKQRVKKFNSYMKSRDAIRKKEERLLRNGKGFIWSKGKLFQGTKSKGFT